MKNKYKINGKIYTTKKTLKNRIKKILYKYDIGVWIRGKDDKVLRDLLKYHNNYEKKKGSGIKGFRIYKNKYGNRGFYLYRHDGTFTDFSYLKCITNPSYNIFVPNVREVKPKGL